jgi:hypothetical protein
VKLFVVVKHPERVQRQKRGAAAMYPSCENITDSAKLSICGPQNDTEIDMPLFDEDLERIVQLTVFILFGFIFVAGLIGNALVVIGELHSLSRLTRTSHECFSCFRLLRFSCCFQSSDEVDDQHPDYKFGHQ